MLCYPRGQSYPLECPRGFQLHPCRVCCSWMWEPIRRSKTGDSWLPITGSQKILRIFRLEGKMAAPKPPQKAVFVWKKKCILSLAILFFLMILNVTTWNAFEQGSAPNCNGDDGRGRALPQNQPAPALYWEASEPSNKAGKSPPCPSKSITLWLKEGQFLGLEGWGKRMK